MNAEAPAGNYIEVPLLALSENDRPSQAVVHADDLPPEPKNRPDRIPCTFHGKGLSLPEWVIGKGFYDAACAWRLELGGQESSVRFNRRALAGFLHAYRGVPPLKHIPAFARQAARAGMERAVLHLTGHVVRLRQRPKPLKRREVEAEPEGDGTMLLFR